MSRAFRQLGRWVGNLRVDVDHLRADVDHLRDTVRELSQTVNGMGNALGDLTASDVDMLATSEAATESFKAYRQRAEKIMDLLQVAAT